VAYMLGARSVVAGNLIMLLAIWIMVDPHFTHEKAIAAGVMMAAVLLLVLGIDWRKHDE
jgi:hypothetical protein